MKEYFVYIMASKKNGTIYAGVTSDLSRRVYEHKNNLLIGFTAKYSVHNLVYFESFNDIRMAIAREKTIKGWTRKKKLALFELTNPNWDDLSEGWYSSES